MCIMKKPHRSSATIEKKGMLLTINEAGSDGVVKAIQKGIAAKK